MVSIRSFNPLNFIQMNKQDFNQFQMLESTVKYLEENASVFEGNAILTEGVARLKQNLELIYSIQEKIEVLDLPFSVMKEMARKRYADAFVNLLKVLRQINLAKKDEELSLLLRTTFTALRYGQVVDNLVRGRAIVEKAEEHFDTIKSLPNGEAIFQETKDLYDELASLKNKPLERISRARGLRNDIDSLLNQSKDICKNELDGLVALYSNNTSFTFGYDSNRRVRKVNSPLPATNESDNADLTAGVPPNPTDSAGSSEASSPL